MCHVAHLELVCVGHDTWHHASRGSEGTGWQMTELPYAGGKLSLVILLPGAGQLNALRGQMTSEWLNAAVAQMTATPGDIFLALPKFRYDFGTVSLKPTLEAAGMKDAFAPHAADFSAIEPTRELVLFVGEVDTPGG